MGLCVSDNVRLKPVCSATETTVILKFRVCKVANNKSADQPMYSVVCCLTKYPFLKVVLVLKRLKMVAILTGIVDL